MSRQTGCFQYTKNISKFGYDPKERHDYTLVKRLDPKESHGSFYWQCIGPNESHVRNERHVSLFKHKRVCNMLYVIYERPLTLEGWNVKMFKV